MPLSNLPHITDRYTVLKRLGQGGMGEVLKCHDQRLRRDVAVKIISYDASDNAVSRFHTEAKATASLGHRNIMQVLDFGLTDEDELFLVMELLDGSNLSEFIAGPGKLAFDEAYPVLRQICQGMSHAHLNGVLHRDLKPSNIMIVREDTGDHQVKLVDFGLAKVIGQDQRYETTAHAVGSPPYMAPEQSSGRQDERSDIYSFGCLAFHLLSGAPPFKADNPLATMLLHRKEPAPTLQERTQQIFPELLEQLVARCLKKNPADRYKNFDQVIESLDAVQQANQNLHSESALELPPEPVPLKVSEALTETKRRSIVLVAVIIVLASASVLVGSLHSIDEAAEKRLDRPVSLSTQKIPGPAGEIYLDRSDRKPVVKTLGNVTDESLINAMRNPAFHEVTFWDLSGATSLTARGLSALREREVITLDLTELNLDSAMLTEVSRHKELKYLTVKSCLKIEPEHFSILRRLPNLVTLEINQSNWGRDMYEVIADLPALTNLNFSKMELQGRSLTPLSKARKLRHLYLKAVAVDDEVFPTLSTIETLRFIRIEKQKLSVQAIRDLRSSQVTGLKFEEMRMNDENIRALASIKSLTNAEFVGSGSIEQARSLHENRPDLCVIYEGKQMH